MDGAGGMETEIYDPDSGVASAGGIAAFVADAIENALGDIMDGDEVMY